MGHRMERATHSIHACTLAQLGKQGAGSVAVRLAGVGRISPHCIINNLRGFFQVHVQRCLANVQAALQAFMTGLANFGGLRSSSMVVLEFAGVRGRVGGLRMHRNQFRFEFTKKLFPLEVGVGASLFWAFASLYNILLARRRSLGAALDTWPAAIRMTGSTRSLLWHVGQASRSAG